MPDTTYSDYAGIRRGVYAGFRITRICRRHRTRMQGEFQLIEETRGYPYRVSRVVPGK